MPTPLMAHGPRIQDCRDRRIHIRADRTDACTTCDYAWPCPATATACNRLPAGIAGLRQRHQHNGGE